MPPTIVEEPFTCEEGWSVPGLRWGGLRLTDVLALAEPLPAARYVRAGAGPYVVPVPLAEVGVALLADEVNGESLSVEHGAPWRLVLPSGACYTSVKWLDRLELTAEPGEHTAQRLARVRLEAALGSELMANWVTGAPSGRWSSTRPTGAPPPSAMWSRRRSAVTESSSAIPLFKRVVLRQTNEPVEVLKSDHVVHFAGGTPDRFQFVEVAANRLRRGVERPERKDGNHETEFSSSSRLGSGDVRPRSCWPTSA